jgi:hypothetical protein
VRAQPEIAPMYGERTAQIALARGDIAEARRMADEAVAATTDKPYHAMLALMASARVAMADKQIELAEDHAHDALAHGVRVEAYLGVPDILECLAGLADFAASGQAPGVGRRHPATLWRSSIQALRRRVPGFRRFGS